MVNPNIWSTESSTDDEKESDDSSRRPSRSSLPPSVISQVTREAVTPPVAEQAQEGVMYTRVPLSELISRHVEAKLEDNEDDEDDSERKYDSHSARPETHATVSDADEVTEAPTAEALEAVHGDQLVSEQGTEIDAEQADDGVAGEQAVTQDEQKEAPADELTISETRPDESPVVAPDIPELPPVPVASVSEANPSPAPSDLQEAAPAPVTPPAYVQAAHNTLVAPPTYNPDYAHQPPSYHAASPNVTPAYGFSEPVAEHLNYRATAAAVPAETVANTRDRRLGPAFLTAVGIDYFARRRMKKQNAAEHDQIRQTQERVAERQQQFAAEQQRTNERQVYFNREQQEFNQEQQRFQEQQHRLQREQSAQSQEVQPIQPMRPEQPAAIPLTYGSEQLQPVMAAPQESQPLESQRFESPRPVAVERPIAPAIVAPEVRPPQKQVAEQPAMPVEETADRRHQERVIEVQDAWLRHKIKNGREVTEGRVFGEAYHQERQQEIRQDPAGDTVSRGAGSGAAAYSVTGFAASDGLYTQSQQAQPQHYASLPSGMTTPSLPQGQNAGPQHQLAAGEEHGEQVKSNITNPWFWLMLMLIVAAFFTAALI